MSTGKFTESDLENGALLPFFTQSTEHGGLGWMQGTDSMVDKARCVVREDLLLFLKTGTPGNTDAFQEAMKIKRHKDEFAFIEDFCEQTLDPLLKSEINAAYILQKNVMYAGQTFTLYNAAPSAGDVKTQCSAFALNALRVIPQVRYRCGAFVRIPDLMMFVNGLYFGYCEIKANPRKQTARREGREKIARDIVDALALALTMAQTNTPWNGWRSCVQHDVIAKVYPFIRAVHWSTVDMRELWILNDIDWLPAEIDDCLRANAKKSACALTIAQRDALIERVVQAFQHAPAPSGYTLFEDVKYQLLALYHARWGINREIHYFQYTFKKRTTALEPMHVRAPQRMMLCAGLQRIESLYEQEHIPKLHGPALTQLMNSSDHRVDAHEMQRMIEAATAYQNGKDTFSVLLQGAAGLGKTNVMVWMARALAEAQDRGSRINKPLFDCVLVLTDRTELRDNMADEAARTRGTTNLIVKAETFKELVEHLGTARVIVVNIQKFPSIVKHLDAPENARLKTDFGSKRVAFIIDEIHRSQSGSYHDSTLDIFDTLGQLGVSTPGQVVRTRRNLIVGFTATPRDEILARFGEWRAPKGPGHPNEWAPYYTYSVKQAIEDGIVLDVTKNIVPFQDVLAYDLIETQRASSGATVSDVPDVDVYQHPKRIEFIAGHIAKIFASTTIYSGRKPNGRGYTLYGDGKAMVVAYSIKAAILYHAAIKKALQDLAAQPQYADRQKLLMNTPVLIVYSDAEQDAPRKCKALNNGLNQEKVIEVFRCKKAEVENAIIIVVDKLLTGFDEPSLHTLFVDKGLNDVLLLQAFYRVGRIAKYKTNCLIVDFSRNNVVSSRVKPVFDKYAGMTISQFDALPIEDKMNAAYNFIFCKDLKAAYQAWATMCSSGIESDRTQASAALLALLVECAETRPEQAKEWQRMLSLWLSTSQLLKNILDFTQAHRAKHWDTDKRDFARDALNNLNGELDARCSIDYPAFDVVGVDLVHIENEGLDAPDVSDKAPTGAESAVYPSVGASEHEQDLADFIMALQEKSDENLTNIERIQHALSVLFATIDDLGKAQNNDIFVKKILERAAGTRNEPYEERIKEFHALFNKACMHKNVRLLAHPKTWHHLWTLENKLLDDYETWVLLQKSATPVLI